MTAPAPAPAPPIPEDVLRRMRERAPGDFAPPPPRNPTPTVH